MSPARSLLLAVALGLTTPLLAQSPPPLPGAAGEAEAPQSSDDWAPLPDASSSAGSTGDQRAEEVNPDTGWRGAASAPTESQWQGEPIPGTQPRAAALTDPKVEHYGWRFLFADPVVIGLFTWGVFSGSPGMVVGGLALHLINGPLIHFFSGELGSAGWSFMARLTTVPTLMLLFLSLNLSPSLSCQTGIACRNLLYGLVAGGMVVAWLYDVFNAQRPPSEAMRLWSAAPAMGVTDRGDTTWGLSVRF